MNDISAELATFFHKHNLPLTAETWRDPSFPSEAVYSAILMMNGSRNTVREYIDGSKIIEAGFEIRVRIHAHSAKDRADDGEFFSCVSEAVKSSDESLKIREISGMTKSVVYDNGDEEFHAGYTVRFKEI